MARLRSINQLHSSNTFNGPMGGSTRLLSHAPLRDGLLVELAFNATFRSSFARFA